MSKSNLTEGKMSKGGLNMKPSADRPEGPTAKRSKCRIFSVRLQYFDDDLISHVMIQEPRPKCFQGITIVTTRNNVAGVVPQSFAVSVLDAMHRAGYYSDDEHDHIKAYIATTWDGNDVIYQQPQAVQVPAGMNFKARN